MHHVALLRGINVGGTNKVAMKELKEVFEEAGLTSVRTYINSGNVIFSTDLSDRRELTALLEKAVADHFGLTISVLVRDVTEVRKIVDAMPGEWANDDTTKCDVLFLWDEIDRPDILDKLEYDVEQEDVRYAPGAVIWCVPRKHATRSRLTKIVGTKLYRQMTIRNCNTARRLLSLLEEQGGS
jgi:uncharacterized protein (DUF1697 family)